MNRIILIGNGFDLAHGLKTSYKDFIDDFWKTKKVEVLHGLHKESYSIKYTYKDEFLDIQSPCEFSELPHEINTNAEGFKWFKNLSRKEYIIRIDHDNDYDYVPLKVYYNKYLETISNKNTLKNWVDIEDEYYQLLKKCYEDNISYNIATLNSDFSVLRAKLKSYLKNQVLTTVKKIRKLIKKYIHLFLLHILEKQSI